MALLLDRLASTRKRITMAEGFVKISDDASWFKHVEPPELQLRLKSLRTDEIITLEIDGVRGECQRMNDGKYAQGTTSGHQTHTASKRTEFRYKHPPSETFEIAARHQHHLRMDDG